MSFSDIRFSDFNFHYKSVVSKHLAEEKILEITIDNKLNFESHIKNICTVANQKLSALCRISNCIHSGNCKLLVNAFC